MSGHIPLTPLKGGRGKGVLGGINKININISIIIIYNININKKLFNNMI